MRHFIVTTGYWRGVAGWVDRRNLRGTIRRACSWRPAGMADAQGPWAPPPLPPNPLGYCDSCVAYWRNLVRMKVKVYQ